MRDRQLHWCVHWLMLIQTTASRGDGSRQTVPVPSSTMVPTTQSPTYREGGQGPISVQPLTPWGYLNQQRQWSMYFVSRVKSNDKYSNIQKKVFLALSIVCDIFVQCETAVYYYALTVHVNIVVQNIWKIYR